MRDEMNNNRAIVSSWELASQLFQKSQKILFVASSSL